MERCQPSEPVAVSIHVKLASFFVSLVVLGLSAPAASAGTPPLLPEGPSGANQYTETLPGAGGNETTRGIHEKEGGSGAKTPAAALGRENAARLEALGAAGREAARLAAAGAPRGVGGARAGGGAGRSGSSTSGSSAVGQILGQLTGSSDSGGGMGLLLPLLIVAAIVAAAAFVIGYRRAPQD